MAEKDKDPALGLGLYGRRGKTGITSAEIVAILLSILWIGAVAAFFLTSGPGEAAQADALGLVVKLLAIFLPIAVIWVGAAAARSARIMREEASRLQAAIDALRQSYLAQAQSTGIGVKPSVEAKLDQIAAAQKKTDTAIATFTSHRDKKARQRPATQPAVAAAPPAEGSAQPTLALGTPAEDISAPVSMQDFIRAMNFPEDGDDKEGFAALRRALQDRQVAKLIQAAQDILTLLSQEGIYMDDLRPDRARPEIWRKFARGDHGRSVAALGGVRDRSSLALTAGRMRQDPIFRDAAHHFLRQFDKTFVGFEANASDLDIAALSDTRTARAFMLLGRVTGTFD